MPRGTPAYLATHGRPRKPEDLAAHRNIVFAEPKPMDELTFVRGRRKVRVKLNMVMMSNIGGVALEALLRGIGLATIPSFLAQRELQAGRIEPILLDWSLFELGVFAVYPHRRFLSPKVKVFIEALRATFGDGTRDCWWPEKRVR